MDYFAYAAPAMDYGGMLLGPQLCPFCVPEDNGGAPPLCFHQLGPFLHGGAAMFEGPVPADGGAWIHGFEEPGSMGHRSESGQTLDDADYDALVGAGLEASRGAAAAGGSPATCTNIYVSNLPPTATDAWLRAEFGKYGLITSTRVMMNHGRTRNKGYGFVQFTEAKMARAAVDHMNGAMLGGSVVGVKLADRDKNRGVCNRPSTNIYVGNLPLHYGVSDVAALFSDMGTVSSMVVLTDPMTGTSRGVGLVRFSTVEAASAAVAAYNGVVLPGHDRPLEVKYAENQAEKQARKHGPVAAAAAP
eukprot:RCo005343